MDNEQYIHEGVADQGATEFFRALSKVCMDISDQSQEKPARQVWLTVSARCAALSEFIGRSVIGGAS